MQKSRNSLLKSKQLLYFIIASLFIAMIYLYHINDLKSIVVINDEFGYWGIAAFLSGKKWGSLMTTVPYYSFGYSLLLVPLYLLNLEVSTMYQIAIVFNVVMIILSYWISIACWDEMFTNDVSNIKFLVCFVITFYPNNIIQAQQAWTETLLYLLVWVLFYCFIRTVKKPSWINIVLGIFVGGYMYSVHQRTIGIVLVYFLMLGVILLRNKQYKYMILAIILFVCLFCLNSEIKNYIIDNLFTSPELVSMNNIQGQTDKITNILTTPSGFAAFVQSMIGKFYYISLVSLFIVPLVLFVGIKKIKELVVRFFRSKGTELDNETYIYIFVVLSFLSLFMITAISMYVHKGRLDLLIYGRYMEMAIGPLLLLGIYYIINNKYGYEKYILVSVIVIVSSSLLVNYGLVDADSEQFNAICATGFYYFFKNRTAVDGLAFVIVVTLLFAVCCVFVGKKKHYKVTTCIMIAIVWFGLAMQSGTLEQQEYITKTVLPIVDVLNSRDVDNIYYLDSESETTTGQTYIKYVQFFEKDKEIKRMYFYDLEELDISTNDYIICDSNAGYQETILDNYVVLEKTNVLKVMSKKE